MDINKDHPLVSVCVVTYNSSNTIIETLQSILLQTYPNIELVVSDDASTDDTIDKCQKWIEKNGQRFVRTSVFTVSENKGVAANVNRALNEAHGEWIKSIAGDDLLTEDCVDIYMRYIKAHPEFEVLFARVKKFKVQDEKIKILGISPSFEDQKYFDYYNQLPSYQKYREMLENGIKVQSPTIFVKKSVFEMIKFPEEYRFMEDHPMWLRMAKNGVNIYMVPEVTVLYRIGNSLSKNVDEFFYSRLHMASQSLFFWNECRQYYIDENIEKGYNRNMKLLLKYEMIEAFTQNKVSFKNKIIRRFVFNIVNKFAHFELPNK